MATTNIILKYTKSNITVKEYGAGLYSYVGIYNQYYGKFLRDRVICRIDAMRYLSMYFKKETLDKYRDAIYLLISRQVTDVKMISNVLIELADLDSLFANRISELYYLGSPDESFGDLILGTLANNVISKESIYRSFFKGKKEVVICLSDGYLYFSVQDIDKPVMLLGDVKGEVVSYAKNWSGQFTYE